MYRLQRSEIQLPALAFQVHLLAAHHATRARGSGKFPDDRRRTGIGSGIEGPRDVAFVERAFDGDAR